ncbi:MAG: RNA polymerase sigma factor [Prevotella sp.]|nr:RNA polymerase sigma factor [Prevotella sp.]
MESLSDISLVTQVAVFRNRRAFDRLVRKYQSPVRRFLLNLTLGNEALSDDLAQDTFLKAYEHIAQFRGIASFQTWLFRIAYNVFYDYKRAPHSASGGPIIDSALETIEAPSGAVGGALDIHTALSMLKDEERACITLQLIDGYPIGEIARMTGMKENTVKSHLRRGKEKLTEYLKRNGYDGNR